MWNKIEVLRCGMDLKIKKWDTNICSPDRFIIKVSVISWQGHFYSTYRLLGRATFTLLTGIRKGHF